MARARVTVIGDVLIEQRVDSARSHAWRWLAEQGENDLFHFRVDIADGRKRITPDDATIVAAAYLLVESLAAAMADFSFFPHKAE